MEEEKGEGATAWEVPKILTEMENKTLLWTAASPWRWPALEGPSGAGGLWRSRCAFPQERLTVTPERRWTAPTWAQLNSIFADFQ